MIRNCVTFWLLIGWCSMLGAIQSDSRTMTPEILWSLGRVGDVAASPDGLSVAWTVRRYDISENSGRTDLVICDIESKTEVKLLSGWKSISDVQWIGSGETTELWFAGKKGAGDEATGEGKANEESAASVARIFHIARSSIGEGEPGLKVAPVKIDEAPSNLKVAPNGKRVAFTMRVKLDQTVNDLYPDLPLADARIIDGLMYRHWDTWHDYKYSHLFVADVGEEAASPTDLMEGQKNHCPVPPFGGSEQFAWSPDSSQIAYTTKISENPAESTDSSVWVVTVDAPSTARCVTPGRPGYDNNPVWSSDGSKLAFHAMERAGFEADRNRFYIVDLASGRADEFTAGLDQNVHNTSFAPDGGIVFDSESKGTDQIFELNRDRQLRQISTGDFDWHLVSVLRGGKQAIVTQTSMLRATEVHLMDLQTGGSVAISHVNDEVFAELDMPTVARREVKATDGETITCWVIYPPGFDPEENKKWPLLLYCQGGPQSQVSQFFSYRWNFHLMAAQGYVVMAPNRRGLPGFGQKWNDDISGDWGGQAMQDYLSATDDISQEPYIDRNRRGAVGASFGGYSVYWLMGNHDNRFSAMIAHCGVFNLESMYGETEELFFVNYDLGGPYWRSPATFQQYQAFSPHRFVQNWKTPLLVIHGEQDFRVPIGQGMEAFTAAQVQDVPSRFLYFPDEGHWVTSPQNSILWQRVFFDWLDRYCKNAR